MRLVHLPESPDPKFSLYVDAPEEGSVYTTEDGALIQHPRCVDGRLDNGCEVDFDRGVPDEAVPHLRAIEALLNDVAGRLTEIDALYTEWKRRPV